MNIYFSGLVVGLDMVTKDGGGPVTVGIMSICIGAMFGVLAAGDIFLLIKVAYRLITELTVKITFVLYKRDVTPAPYRAGVMSRLYIPLVIYITRDLVQYWVYS